MPAGLGRTARVNPLTHEGQTAQLDARTAPQVTLPLLRAPRTGSHQKHTPALHSAHSSSRSRVPVTYSCTPVHR